MKQILFNPKILKKLFSYKTTEMCKSCKRYGTKATCPPHIPSLGYYKNVLPSYKYGIMYYENFLVDNPKDWKDLGASSSLRLHKKLVEVRKTLLSKGHYYVVVFGAGSCKLCPTCKFPCRHPDRSIVPLEGTGVDVFRLLKKHKVAIDSPIKNSFYRVGVVLYD